MVQPLWKTVCIFLKKLKTKSYYLATLLALFKLNEYRILKRYLHYQVYCIIFHNSQDTETAQVAFFKVEWIKLSK